LEVSGQLHTRPLYPGKRVQATHWTGVWVDHRVTLDAVPKRNTSCPRQESKPGHPAHSLVTTLTELRQLIWEQGTENIWTQESGSNRKLEKTA